MKKGLISSLCAASLILTAVSPVAVSAQENQTTNEQSKKQKVNQEEVDKLVQLMAPYVRKTDDGKLYLDESFKDQEGATQELFDSLNKELEQFEIPTEKPDNQSLGIMAEEDYLGDRTAQWKATMNANAEVIQEDFEDAKPGIYASPSAWAAYTTYRYVYFYDKVKYGGVWDFKARYSDPMNTTAKFNGEIISIEEFGNIHYGYVGKAGGFGDEELKLAAGIAQKAAGSEWSFESYWDDPRDQENIEYGIELYEDGF